MTVCALTCLRILLVFAVLAPALYAAEPGSKVVVVYNSRMPESKDIADHYAERRDVPQDQILGLDLPTDEIMSRADYRDRLQHPLLQFLENNYLMVYASPKATKPASAKIRYIVLCYGVPLRITEDDTLREAGLDKVQPELRRNGAAVDSELCTLPTQDPKVKLTGPLRNPGYAVTNGRVFDPINGLLLVARLDGPSAAVARQLVDKAMEAETNGLWGRAYFDLRGLADGPYKLGDDWIGAAAEASRSYGFETAQWTINLATFPDAFPIIEPDCLLVQAGMFGMLPAHLPGRGWEFMPGALAYHLQSFQRPNAARSTTLHISGAALSSRRAQPRQ